MYNHPANHERGSVAPPSFFFGGWIALRRDELLSVLSLSLKPASSRYLPVSILGRCPSHSTLGCDVIRQDTRTRNKSWKNLLFVSTPTHFSLSSPPSLFMQQGHNRTGKFPSCGEWCHQAAKVMKMKANMVNREFSQLAFPSFFFVFFFFFFFILSARASVFAHCTRVQNTRLTIAAWISSSCHLG